MVIFSASVVMLLLVCLVRSGLKATTYDLHHSHADVSLLDKVDQPEELCIDLMIL